MSHRDETVLIKVSAGVIEREGAFLMTRRLPGTHLAGYWEFPGGKRHSGESVEDCLRRELREELAVQVEVGTRIAVTRHAYPDRSVEITFLRCRLVGEPNPQLGQEMRWIPRPDLPAVRVPPADQQLVSILMG